MPLSGARSNVDQQLLDECLEINTSCNTVHMFIPPIREKGELVRFPLTINDLSSSIIL